MEGKSAGYLGIGMQITVLTKDFITPPLPTPTFSKFAKFASDTGKKAAISRFLGSDFAEDASGSVAIAAVPNDRSRDFPNWESAREAAFENAEKRRFAKLAIGRTCICLIVGMCALMAVIRVEDRGVRDQERTALPDFATGDQGIFG